MDSREFPNPYADFNSKLTVLENGKLKDDIVSNLRENVLRLLRILEDNLERKRDAQSSDNSVYTGVAGISLLYFRLHQAFGNDNLQTAKRYCDIATSNLKGRRVSFLCGDAGPLALAAVIYNKMDKDQQAQDFISRLEALHRQVILVDTDLPDEVLYGRAGYLYSLLFVQHHVGKAAIKEEIILKVVKSILVSGQQMASAEETCPLFYKWHGKPYIGAAHGLVGILYVLLLAKEYITKSELENLILPTVEFVVSLKFKSSNYPSSLGNASDKLVHWCHGAPGVIHLLVKTYQISEEKRFLDLSIKCANLIWHRGLLKKGYGICHGVAGNGYAFLKMYQLTKDESYLYRAIKFAEWCCDYGNHECPIADRPYSLFEGLAGTIYYMIEALSPKESAFPAFAL